MARVDNTGGAGYVIDNGTGAAVRTKLNQISAAINSLNSGSGDPSINSAFQPHIDTGSSLFKIRNAANNAYVTIGNISCLLYTSPSPRDATLSRMPSSA